MAASTTKAPTRLAASPATPASSARPTTSIGSAGCGSPTDDRRPTTDDRRPTTDDRPTTNDQRRLSFIVHRSSFIVSITLSPCHLVTLSTVRGDDRAGDGQPHRWPGARLRSWLDDRPA